MRPWLFLIASRSRRDGSSGPSSFRSSRSTFTGTLAEGRSGIRPDRRARRGGAGRPARAASHRSRSPAAGDVSWLFAPAHRRPTEDETELTAGDLDVVWYEDFVVPFDPLVEEQLQLELPMKPLCRPDCRGLCPRCGADRNSAPCDCREEGDERLAKLKSLLR